MKNCWNVRSGKSALLVFFFLNTFLRLTAQDNPYMFPVRPQQQNYLSGTMGELRGVHFHAGMDIKTSGTTGLKVHAAADGYISRIKVDGGGYGNALYIAHPQLGTTTVYGHLKKFNDEIARYVLEAQYKKRKFAIELFPGKEIFPVKKGDVIAFSGNSGSSAGPHLHFEIRDTQQRPLNPLQFKFAEIKDNISPVVQKIGLKTMNKYSRVSQQFDFFEFTPSQVGRNYSIKKPIEVYGVLGLYFMGYDKLNGASNRNGIPHIEVEVDGRQLIEINIDKVPFSKTRQIMAYRDYRIKMQENKSFQKLFIDDGNTLDFYTTDGHKGFISVRDTLVHEVIITLEDAYGNASTVNFSLKGSKPKVTATEDDPDFRPFRHYVLDNTLVFMGTKAETNGYFANVYADRIHYELDPAYYVNDYSVYLWDLRNGIPDSIELCGKKIIPGLEIAVPPGKEFKYFQDRFDVHFFKNTLFDTLYLKTDYIDELDPGMEIFEISEDIYPLQKNMEVILKPALNYRLKDKTRAYYTTDLKEFGYQGGEWDGRYYKFYTRTLGKYTLLTDTVPPKIRVVQQNRDYFRCYITDDLSGIKDYELHIGGEWVLMNYDPKRNYIWTEKLDKRKPFSGELELKVRDNVNNERIYTTTIK